MEKSGLRSQCSRNKRLPLEMRDAGPRNNWDLPATFWAARSSIPARGTCATFPKPLCQKTEGGSASTLFRRSGLALTNENGPIARDDRAKVSGDRSGWVS